MIKYIVAFFLLTSAVLAQPAPDPVISGLSGNRLQTRSADSVGFVLGADTLWMKIVGGVVTLSANNIRLQATTAGQSTYVDSALKIDTTYVGFTSYVTTHAAGGGDNVKVDTLPSSSGGNWDVINPVFQMGSGITFSKNGPDTILITTVLGPSVDLTSEVVGILPTANGGFGSSTKSNGQIPIGDGDPFPTFSTITAGSGISITNGAGTITIANTGGGGGGGDIDAVGSITTGSAFTGGVATESQWLGFGASSSSGRVSFDSGAVSGSEVAGATDVIRVIGGQFSVGAALNADPFGLVTVYQSDGFKRQTAALLSKSDTTASIGIGNVANIDSSVAVIAFINRATNTANSYITSMTPAADYNELQIWTETNNTVALRATFKDTAKFNVPILGVGQDSSGLVITDTLAVNNVIYIQGALLKSFGAGLLNTSGAITVSGVTSAMITNATIALADMAANSVDSTKITTSGVSWANLSSQAQDSARAGSGAAGISRPDSTFFFVTSSGDTILTITQNGDTTLLSSYGNGVLRMGPDSGNIAAINTPTVIARKLFFGTSASDSLVADSLVYSYGYSKKNTALVFNTNYMWADAADQRYIYKFDTLIAVYDSALGINDIDTTKWMGTATSDMRLSYLHIIYKTHDANSIIDSIMFATTNSTVAAVYDSVIVSSATNRVGTASNTWSHDSIAINYDIKAGKSTMVSIVVALPDVGDYCQISRVWAD